MPEKKMTIQELRDSQPHLGRPGAVRRVPGSARRRAMAVAHEAEALAQAEQTETKAPKAPRKPRKAKASEAPEAAEE